MQSAQLMAFLRQLMAFLRRRRRLPRTRIRAEAHLLRVGSRLLRTLCFVLCAGQRMLGLLDVEAPRREVGSLCRDQVTLRLPLRLQLLHLQTAARR